MSTSSTTKDLALGIVKFTRKKVALKGGFKAIKGVPAAIHLSGAHKGYATEGDLAVDLLSIGRFMETVDNTLGSDGDLEVEVDFGREVHCHRLDNDAGSPVVAATVGSPVYFKNNRTVRVLASSTSIAGICWGFDEDSKVLVEPTSRFIPVATDAASVSVADSASLFTGTDTEAALAELAKNYGYLHIPVVTGLLLASGSPMSVFADGASSVPGVQVVDSKSAVVRWNNHATPAAIVCNAPAPEDLDDSAAVVLYAMVSKVGATVGDATKLTIAGYEVTVGALHDADADFGGDTDAVTGNATSKTVQLVTLTFAAGDIHATPSGYAIHIKPKAGTLGTDDLCLHACWLKYVRKNRAA